jgi:hypothetical protein
MAYLLDNGQPKSMIGRVIIASPFAMAFDEWNGVEILQIQNCLNIWVEESNFYQLYQ